LQVITSQPDLIYGFQLSHHPKNDEEAEHTLVDKKV
jgi:hypothetical protein